MDTTLGIFPAALPTLGVALLGLTLLALQQRSKKVYPPGPKGHWLIGNLLDLPSKIDPKVLESWKDHYDDLLFLRVPGTSILVLNSFEVVNDLLEKRYKTYSHRPRFVMAGELMGLNKSMALMEYGEGYKQCRKLTHQGLNPEAVKSYREIQESIVYMYLDSLLKRPEDFVSEIRLAAGRIVLGITYGFSPKTADSEFITDADTTMDLISRSVVPGAYLADLIPALKHLPRWLPGTSYFAAGDAGFNQILNFVTRPFVYVKRELESGQVRPSLVSNLLTHQRTDSEEDEAIKWVAGSMYGAGAETTYATTLVFFILMAQNPEKQRKAQEEVDRVIGKDRLPNLSDKGTLPYVEALIREVARWHSVLPLSIARQTSQDDMYNGYFIPAGTIVVPNVHAMSKIGADRPKEFIPERFLEEDPTKRPTDPFSYIFGFGRRTCPGKYLAENSLFILMASILSTFNISLPVDKDGNELPITPQYEPYLISYPKKFECRIRPRHGQVGRQIDEYLATAGGYLHTCS